MLLQWVNDGSFIMLLDIFCLSNFNLQDFNEDVWINYTWVTLKRTLPNLTSSPTRKLQSFSAELLCKTVQSWLESLVEGSLDIFMPSEYLWWIRWQRKDFTVCLNNTNQVISCLGWTFWTLFVGWQVGLRSNINIFELVIDTRKFPEVLNWYILVGAISWFIIKETVGVSLPGFSGNFKFIWAQEHLKGLLRKLWPDWQ